MAEQFRTPIVVGEFGDEIVVALCAMSIIQAKHFENGLGESI